MVSQLSIGLKKHDISVDLLTLSNKRNRDVECYKGYHLHRAKMSFEVCSTGFSVEALAIYSRLIKLADIVHYHFPWPFMDLMHLIVGVDKPSIVTYHSDIIRQKKLLKIYSPVMNLFLNSVNHIVATSPNYLATSDVLQRYHHKVSVIPIGLSKELYPCPDINRLDFWRRKFGSKFFLFIGVFRYYKGLSYLVEAIQNTDIQVVIIGAGGVEAEIRASVMKLGITNLHFTGPLSDSDKVSLISLCLAVILPSNQRSEAFGISLLEGAMFSKPLISCELGTGTSFINNHGSTGLVVAPSNSAELFNALNFLWNNPASVERMGLNAYNRYKNLFSLDRSVELYCGLYKKLLG